MPTLNQRPLNNGEIFYTTGALADTAGVSRQTVLNYIAQGLIKIDAYAHHSTDGAGNAALFSRNNVIDVIDEVRRLAGLSPL